MATERQPPSASASAAAGVQQPAGTSNKPLRSLLLDPTVRSAPQAARDVSAEEIGHYRTMPYERYLLTAHWRNRRNRSLKLARYKCERCSAGRELQVHHLSYERLGCELDEDLQVLCRGCHLGHHVLELHEQLAVYTRIISDVLQSGDFESVADLSEEAKRRCAKAKIPYTEGQIQAALARMGKRLDLELGVPAPKKYAELLDAGSGHQPLTHAEACGFLAKLGAHAKPMPTVKRISQRKADARVMAKQIAALILDQVQQCEDADAALDSELAKGAL